MKYCKRCLFPDTKPDIYFDEEGICDPCRSAERKHGVENAIDWEERAREFQELLDRYRSPDGMHYDCIVPVSGGKDSCFQAYAMKVIHKMNPLAVTFDQFDATDVSRHNLDVLRSMGVDHIHFTLNPNVVKRLVRKGFEIVGDTHWVNHVGIFSVPTRVAVNYNIPLLIWGEQPQLEYGGPARSRDKRYLDKRWRQEFGGMRGFREEDMVDDEMPLSDLKALLWPTDEEIHRIGVTGVFYGYFFKWNAQEHIRIGESYGWRHMPEPQAGSWLDYENCDMGFIDIREHLKWVKYGYGRTTDQVNIHIRSGMISRDEGIKIVRERDGRYAPESRRKFCEFIGITEDDFRRIRDTFVNTDIFEPDGRGEWVLKNEII